MQTWKCCGRNYSNGVKACRKCRKPRPAFGIIDKPKKPSASKEQGKTGKINRTRDPLIGLDNSPAVSTLKMKDGRTAEHLKNGKQNTQKN